MDENGRTLEQGLIDLFDQHGLVLEYIHFKINDDLKWEITARRKEGFDGDEVREKIDAIDKEADDAGKVTEDDVFTFIGSE